MAEKKAEIDKRTIQLTKEKELLDNKLKKVEKTLEAENKELRGKLDGVTGDVKSQLAEKDTELNQVRRLGRLRDGKAAGGSEGRARKGWQRERCSRKGKELCVGEGRPS